MSIIESIDRTSWILETFPEWGSWLNEEIELTKVEKNKLAMWWLGCVGVWIKTEGNTNICVDLWCGTGKRNHDNKLIDKNHQFRSMSGCKRPQPNLRVAPFVLDPFSIKNLDALVCTHYHKDHIDVNVAAAVNKNCPDTPFIGPKACVDLWIQWGIKKEKCIELRPGQSYKIKDVEIIALKSFDRTVALTPYPGEDSIENSSYTMDDKALNYIIKTPAGTIYHGGDSHYSNYFAKHGNEHEIDIALGAFGQNPRGITDKMTSSDILRMAEALKAKLVIPLHYDAWSNYQADPNEILTLYNLQKDRLKYEFKPFIWQVGGGLTYPDDKDNLIYNYNRGFEDVFEADNNLPYELFL